MVRLVGRSFVRSRKSLVSEGEGTSNRKFIKMPSPGPLITSSLGLGLHCRHRHRCAKARTHTHAPTDTDPRATMTVSRTEIYPYDSHGIRPNQRTRSCAMSIHYRSALKLSRKKTLCTVDSLYNAARACVALSGGAGSALEEVGPPTRSAARYSACATPPLPIAYL